MLLHTRLKKNSYHDSVTLMVVSREASSREGIERAVALMGTEMNKTALREVGMLGSDLTDACPADLMLALRGVDEGVVREAMAQVEAVLSRRGGRAGEASGRDPLVSHRTLSDAMVALPEANLALISVPGEFAGREARRALESGLHVMLFSDNVPLADEKALKEMARDRGLLVMGPDCGTAIINGIGLAFANKVAKGSIGIIGASGTGIQEVSVQLDRLGEGVSHAIGTGGRDLAPVIGGITMRQALRALQSDSETRVIVLISKPPAPDVAKQVLSLAGESPKPVVVSFLVEVPKPRDTLGVHAASTLEHAALVAVSLLRGQKPPPPPALSDEEVRLAKAEAGKMARTQRYVRGLFAGGTLCHEAMGLLKARLGKPVRSNLSSDPSLRLEAGERPSGHTVVDLGEDEFTRGRPHPMIDPSLRNDWILREASNEDVAVILLDIMLGYGAHADPAGAVAGPIAEARERAAQEGRHLSVVGYVCGSHGDEQGLAQQEARLREAGVVLLPSNASAAWFASAVAAPRGAGRE
ncbi:MAG: acyl-CoA synthetase FdrA [Candidatus Methylomirabilia bacterium]